VSVIFFCSYRTITIDRINEHERISSKTLKENKQSNMSTGATLNVENGKSLTDIFHRFIRLTVKTDDQNGRYKKKHTGIVGSQRQQQPEQQQQQQQQQPHAPPSSRRSQRVVNQAPRVPPRHLKHTSTLPRRNETPVTTDNISYTHTDNEEPDNYYTDHVRFI
jgi:hypothetical protein